MQNAKCKMKMKNISNRGFPRLFAEGRLAPPVLWGNGRKNIPCPLSSISLENQIITPFGAAYHPSRWRLADEQDERRVQPYFAFCILQF